MNKWLCRLVLVVVVLATHFSAAATEVIEYLHTDHLGSIIAVTDAQGNVIERTVHDPYGRPLHQPMRGGPGYTGHVQDPATGLVYMQQRLYDPEIPRLLSVDAVTAYGGDLRHFGPYVYAYNNPYRYTDPDGRLPIIIPIVAGITWMLTSGDAHAPAPGQPTGSMSAGDAADRFMGAVPAGKLAAGIRMGVDAGQQANKRRTGSYTNTHESGRTYNGKGSRERSQESGRRVEQETGDAHVATDWTSATNSRDAFKQESQRLDSNGGPRSDSNFNKIESPGKKMREKDGE